MIRPTPGSAPDQIDQPQAPRVLFIRTTRSPDPGANDPDCGGAAQAHAPRGVAAPSLLKTTDSWDLLGSLTARLRLLAGVAEHANDATWQFGMAASARCGVLDCVAQLEQLRIELAHELVCRQQLELGMFDAQSALAHARAELAGTRAGERHARHLALHDSLTTLPNRRFFGDHLAQALATAAPRRQALAVMYLDLDDFKPINDAHGHAIGDEMLRIVGARLSRAVRAEDIVSRLGGDEFACLLGGLPSRAQISHLACKVFDAVAAPCKIGTLKLRVRPSIGIAMCPEDGVDAEALLRNADAAMYNAKRQHSGYAFFDEADQGWSQLSH